MTPVEVLAWLAARRPSPPDALRTLLEHTVAEAEPSSPLPLPDQLGQLGRRLLARVSGRPEGGRELARELFAADAFTTYAVEDQAEAVAAGVAALAGPVPGSEWCRACSGAAPACSCF